MVMAEQRREDVEEDKEEGGGVKKEILGGRGVELYTRGACSSIKGKLS